MQDIILNNKNYFLVEVSADSFDFITKYEDKYTVLYGKRLSYSDYNPFSSETTYEDTHYIDIILETPRSKGIPKLKIIGKISDILKDEEICKGFTGDSFFYSTDLGGFEGQLYSCDEDGETLRLTARDSFISYLQSIELDLTKEYLLIQKL